MKKEHDEKDKYYFDRKLEIVLKSIEDMNKYNSVVCSIGYISLLAIITYLHDYIYKQLLIWICLFYIGSVVIYVIFEMKKIFLNNTYHSKVMNNLDEFIKNPTEDKEKLTVKNHNTQIECYKDFIEKQNLFFIPSAILGFSAGALIVVNFIHKFAIDIFKSLCCH